jgi:hypothetical protein
MEGIMKKTFLTILLLVSLILGANTAFAGESAKEKNWDFQLAPLYLWMVNMDGEMGIGPIDTGVTVDFGTLFDNLETIFTVHFEGVHRSNWGFLLDISYLDISASQSGGPLALNIDFTTILAEAGGYYRFSRDQHAFDVLAGIRYTKMEPEITFTTPPLPKFDKTEDWVDPIVGVRYVYNFTDKWLLNLRGDIGGFGAGCDFTWNAIGFVQWQPWKYAGIFAGYRALDQDYETGSGADRFKYDMRLHGPVLAVNFIW